MSLDIATSFTFDLEAGAVIGVTGGTACYYLCPAATVTTLGRCRPHRNDAETIRKSDEATGRGFVIAS